MDKTLFVKDIMNTRLITLHPKDNIERAKQVFKEYNIHHILISVMHEIRGIISLGDILYLEGMVLDSFDQFLQDKKSYTTPIEDVMTSNPYRTSPDAELTSAISLMLDKNINALPVVEDEKLVGLITTRDILIAFNNELKK